MKKYIYTTYTSLYFKRSVAFLSITILIIMAAVVVIVLVPKQEINVISTGDKCVITYIGLYLNDAPSISGKFPIKFSQSLNFMYYPGAFESDTIVTAIPIGQFRKMKKHIRAFRCKCKFTIKNSNGVICGTGQGDLVYWYNDPSFFICKITDADYCDHSGNPISWIRNGNGKETYRSQNDGLCVEAFYEKGYWTKVIFWKNGNIVSQHEYDPKKFVGYNEE